MRGYKMTFLGTVLAFGLSPAAFAQTDPVATDPAAAAPMAVDCNADFATLDADGNGYLSETESQRAYARSRVDGTTLSDEGISKEQYNALCASPAWAENTPEEGSPFEGANSFTEEQARDRAVAWNVTQVSALSKDDKGIWRGAGMVDGAQVSVAIDYKGNVVTTPKP